jgi:radical SAM protein with 4Fe4S-binding SPASM domain
MEWGTLRAAIDLAFSRGRSGVEIVFSGGEPLLEFPLIERGVRYIRQNAAFDKRLRLVLNTNGTILDEKKVLFLAEHAFEVQLSFDGVREAQDLRGKHTFDSLDRLLDVLSERYSRFYRSHLKVSMTVTPQTVRHLANSVEYFLAKGVERLTISPSIGDCSDWQPARVDRLESEFSRIVTSSLLHFHRTGRIPLVLLRGRDPGHRYLAPDFAWIPGTSRKMCRVTCGEKLAVDVDGEVFACATVVGSCQRFQSELLRRSAKTMRMGNIRSKTFLENHASFSKTTHGAEIFYRKENKYSSYGRCRDCRYFEACAVCPVSIGHIPGNEDPNRVPDFSCALTFTAARYRDRFCRRAFSKAKETGGCMKRRLQQGSKYHNARTNA